jgi:hypothetical protein
VSARAALPLAAPDAPTAVTDAMIERGLTALAARGWQWQDEAEEMRADVRAVLEAALAVAADARRPSTGAPAPGG